LGQDNDAVLGELGVSDEQIAALREQLVSGERALGARLASDVRIGG
jgi:hypothetical protein